MQSIKTADSIIKHRCANMPEDIELHLDIFDNETWYQGKRVTNKNSANLGGTQVFYCSWCNLDLDTLPKYNIGIAEALGYND